jgi:hypothetical protein
MLLSRLEAVEFVQYQQTALRAFAQPGTAGSVRLAARLAGSRDRDARSMLAAA